MQRPHWNLLETLQLSERYIGVFQSCATDSLLHQQFPPSTDTVAAWTYQHPNGTVVIVMAEQHPEPIMSWLREAHRCVDGTSRLGAALGRSIRLPAATDAYLFVVDLSDIKKSTLAKIVRKNSNLVLYFPSKPELMIIAGGADGLRLSALLPDAQLSTGIVLRNEAHLPQRRRHRSAPYDPVEAQIREIAGPVTVHAAQAVADLQRVWTHVVGTDPPSDIVRLRRFTLESLPEQLGRLGTDFTDTAERNIAFELIDRHAAVIREVSYVARFARERLLQYAQARSSAVATFEETATPVMLRAACKYVRDVARRFGLRDRPILPVIGERFGLWSDAFTRVLADVSMPVPQHDAPTVLIEIASESGLRLGAMPILAHEVAHLVVDECERVIHQIVDHSLSSRWDSDIFAAPPRGQRAELMLALDKYEEMARRSHVVAVFLADVLAALAVGPSYVYALARFAVGTMGEFSRVYSRDPSYPPLPARIRTCISFLRAVGRPVEFRSKFLPDQEHAVPSEIVALIRPLVADVAHDEAESQRIEYALRDGRFVDASPVDVVDVLWSAVVRKSGYLNEIAAASSVANSSRVS